MSDDILDELNASFVSPDREFLGQRLAPYTEGSRLLLLQVRDENDSSIWFVWAFVFLHILLAKDRKEAIKVAWNKELFRERLLDWVAEKTIAEREIATEIVSKIVEEASRAKVEAIRGGEEPIGGKA